MISRHWRLIIAAGLLGLLLWLYATAADGMTPLQSPKDAASQPAKTKASVTAATSTTFVRTNRAFHLTFTCDPMEADAFTLYVATNGQPFTRSITALSVPITISNLWPGEQYVFTMTASGITEFGEDESAFATPFVLWPMPVTNWLAIGWSVAASGPWTTNTLVENPTNGFWRGRNTPGEIVLETSADMKDWSAVTNWPVATNPPAFFLRQARWDNQGYSHPD